MKKYYGIILGLILSTFLIFQSNTAFAAGVVDMDTGEGTTTSSTEATTDETGLTDTQKDVVTNNDTDLIMGDDYQFGDPVLPKQDTQGFFNRIYKKMFEGLSAVQKIVAIILAFAFVINLVAIAFSFFGQKGKIGWYLVGLLIIAICFVFDLYAVDILNAFTHWSVS